VKQFEDSLFLADIISDSISNIGSLADSCLKDLPDATTPTSQFVLGSMCTAIQKCYPYPFGSGLFDAFSHTLVAGKYQSGIDKARLDFTEIFALLLDSATGTSPSMLDQPTSNRRLTLENLQVRRLSRIYRQMQIAFEAAVKGRRFGTASKGYKGLFPRGTQHGD
jgi:hypothetical protein